MTSKSPRNAENQQMVKERRAGRGGQESQPEPDAAMPEGQNLGSAERRTFSDLGTVLTKMICTGCPKDRCGSHSGNQSPKYMTEEQKLKVVPTELRVPALVLAWNQMLEGAEEKARNPGRERKRRREGNRNTEKGGVRGTGAGSRLPGQNSYFPPSILHSLPPHQRTECQGPCGHPIQLLTAD